MGYNIECICVSNIQSLPKEYFCSVCQLLIDPSDALQSMCTHLYCKPCLAYAASTTMACPYDGCLVTEADAKPLVESNKLLADAIGKVVVHCLYQMSGCKWSGFLSESSSHCSGCAFGSSLVACNWCQILLAHRQGKEHLQVCPGILEFNAFIQGSAALVTSQASAREEGSQQQYHQDYQNNAGYYMHQQHAPMSNSEHQLHLPAGLAPHNASQHQVPYAQPAIQYVAQTHSPVQAQPQLQSQSLAMHQPHLFFPPAPYQGVASQGLHDLQAHAHPQTTPLSQAHHLQNPQVPLYQQFHSQLHIQNTMHPQANIVQKSLPQDTIGQGQPHQPHAYPQPNQTNHVGFPQNNMHMHHNQVGTQPPPVQNPFPQQVPHVPPPHSLATMQTQQPSLPSQLASAQYEKHLLDLVHKYGRAPVSESSVMQPAQQPLSNPSLAQQHTAAPTPDVVHNQMRQGDPFFNPYVSPQSRLPPIGRITPNHGLQPQLNNHSTTALHGGSGQTAPSLQMTQNQITWNHTVGKQGDEATSTTPDQRSSTVVEGYGIKNGRANLGKSPVVEKKCDEHDPSLNGIQLDPNSLEPNVLRHLNIVQKLYLKTFHNDDVQRSGAGSSRSLDRGSDQRSPVRPHERHEPDFDLRPASRLSQPLIDLGEGQLRGGPRSPISEHLGMPSLRPGDIGIRSRYAMRGNPSDDASFPDTILGDVGPFSRFQ